MNSLHIMRRVHFSLHQQRMGLIYFAPERNRQTSRITCRQLLKVKCLPNVQVKNRALQAEGYRKCALKMSH